MPRFSLLDGANHDLTFSSSRVQWRTAVSISIAAMPVDTKCKGAEGVWSQVQKEEECSNGLGYCIHRRGLGVQS